MSVGSPFPSVKKEKHTPGPWVVTVERTIPVLTNVGSGSYGSVCSTHARRPDVRENEDNARLIAAAPDLLEALRSALFTIEHRNGIRHRLDLFTADEREKLASALRKATGDD